MLGGWGMEERRQLPLCSLFLHYGFFEGQVLRWQHAKMEGTWIAESLNDGETLIILIGLYVSEKWTSERLQSEDGEFLFLDTTA